MKQNFHSSRWLGRLTQVLLIFAKNKNIRFNSSPKLLELLTAVLNNSNEKEQSIINGLLEKFNSSSNYETDNHISLDENNFDKNRAKGAKDIEYLVFKNNTIDTEALTTTDFCSIYEKELEELRLKQIARRHKIFKFSIITIVLLLLGIWIYNLEFFRERRMYNKVIDNQETYYCYQYYQKFPEGKHYEDVMNIETNISMTPIKPVTEYLNKFPNGKYSTEMNLKCDSLWDATIDMYNKLEKSQESPEAIKFMNTMLQHMKKERISTIKLQITPQIHLKDFDEYDIIAKRILEHYFSNEPLPFNSTNIVSLKKNFTDFDRNTLYNILCNSFEKSFEQIFTSDFVDIEITNEKSSLSSQFPIINCNYTIQNLNESISSDIEIPNIWIYSSNSDGYNTPQAYILAIDVTFDVSMSIPDNNQKYSYSEIGTPGEEINDVEDINDGYRKMTQACFYEFAQKISFKLGLRNN